MSNGSKDFKPVPFWIWSNWKGIGSNAEKLRTIFDLRMPKETKWINGDRLGYGHGPLMPGELPPIVAELEYASEPDDCPWATSEGLFVVSDRVRGLLEEHGPCTCQFLPVTLQHNGGTCNLVYWAMYVDSIDCADQERCGRNSQGGICEPVIKEERVPPSTYIFRVWDPVKNFSGAELLVRDSLRRVLKREKVTGCFFYEPPVPGMGRPPRES